ncbi:hypothetical protein B0H67DRAFT_602120 [Lasiosphaeris hirsuta]|uniref:Uncharacterized protein n=1 Tax=Lasiosphaeris hirsuta TaxID=260670 RepID=A0AA40DTH1_9PEZI|nr:hypothetical protein B0H67DRAFT_602120 [Lasiosphaeris hirsuta]
MAQRRRRTGTLSASGAGDVHAPLALFYEWASADEKRSFHFFQHVTAPCLSGDFDGVFWRVLVLQICQTEPAVKHAVLAVSSLHEGMMAMAPYAEADDRHSFALSQYNKAIACLLDQMREVDAKPLVPLLTCVLFVCIELMQSKDTESIIHLEQGRQILSRLGRKASSQNSEIDIIKQHLVPMYTRLSLTSLMFGGDPVAIPTPLKTLTDVPMMFDSIGEVRYALYDFMDECLRFAKKTHAAKYSELPEEELRIHEKEQDYLLRKLSKFNVSFSLYQAQRARDAPPGAIALIQIHVSTTYIWISTALSSEETVFDAHVATFSKIIPLANTFMDALAGPVNHDPMANKMTAASPSAADTRRFSALFTFEMHVIAPLYYVAAKCRHPLIRRAALDLLRRNPARRENLWRANVMAAIADHTIRLEEKHLRPRTDQSRSASPPELPTMMPFGGYEPSIQPAVHSPCPSNLDLSFDSPELSHNSGHLPIDPSLLYDATEVPTSSHSFSPGTHSIASSFDDHLSASHTIYVSGTGNNTVAARSDNSSQIWNAFTQHQEQQQQQPHQHQQQQQQHLAPNIALEPPTPSDRSGDAPFDVPEHFRVHDAIIGPEKEDGSWVMMFRKLGGLHADWDVQTDYVADILDIRYQSPHHQSEQTNARPSSPARRPGARCRRSRTLVRRHRLSGCQAGAACLPAALRLPWNVEVIVDEARELYAQWGLGTTSTWYAMSPWNLYSAYRLGKDEGIWGGDQTTRGAVDASGTRWQMGGAFAMDAGGFVRWVKVPSAANDLPNFKEALQALEPAKTGLA